MIKDCSFRRMGNIVPARPALPVPKVRTNPELVGRRVPLFSQQPVFNQAQKRARAGADRKRKKAYKLIIKEAIILNDGGPGSDEQYPKQEL